MGTYKVIQDIEAEDKLLGPLTLKQFIFAIIALACAYLSFLALSKGVGILTIFLAPPMLAFGILAWPWSREQTTEVWLLAKLRFFIKPRKRIWDQSGIKEVVTVTAPVVENKNYSNGLSQGEVKSRLKALASTIDTRGWAIKNVNVNLSGQPSFAMAAGSDRLIDMSSLPQNVTANDIAAADDILDEQNNPTAQNLSRMISATAAAHKQRLVNSLKKPAPKADAPQPQTDYWFLSQPSGPIPAGQAVFNGGVTVRPDDSSGSSPMTDDQGVQVQLQAAQSKQKAAYGNMRTIKPLPEAPSSSLPAPVMPSSPKPSSKTPDPAILKLASNDDLNVATIARQANKKVSDLGDGEVVVPLR